jgi:hypothetical protein
MVFVVIAVAMRRRKRAMAFFVVLTDTVMLTAGTIIIATIFLIAVADK